MGAYTIFIDESGEFAGRVAQGVRLVAAVVMAGAIEDCENTAQEGLERALGRGVLPFHACEYSAPYRLRALLRKRPNLATRLGISGKAPDVHLQKVGARTLVAARQAVGQVILNAQDCVVLCYEHGCYENGIDRWRPMVCAALDQALVWIATRPGGPHTVFGRVAERGEPTTFDLSPTCELLARLAVGFPDKVSAVACNGPLPTALAARSCGLQVADIVAHAMGPRGSASKALGQPAAEGRNRHWLDQRYAVLSALRLAPPGANGKTVAIGAVDETYGAVLHIVREQACGGADAARMILKRLQTQWVNRLPPHTLRCSVEGSVFLGSKVL